MPATNLMATRCPYCGYQHELASHITGPGLGNDPDHTPKDGSVTLCVRCGHFSVFTPDPDGPKGKLKLRRPVLAERREFRSSPALIKLHGAWKRAVKRRGRFDRATRYNLRVRSARVERALLRFEPEPAVALRATPFASISGSAPSALRRQVEQQPRKAGKTIAVSSYIDVPPLRPQIAAPGSKPPRPEFHAGLPRAYVDYAAILHMYGAISGAQLSVRLRAARQGQPTEATCTAWLRQKRMTFPWAVKLIYLTLSERDHIERVEVFAAAFGWGVDDVRVLDAANLVKGGMAGLIERLRVDKRTLQTPAEINVAELVEAAGGTAKDLMDWIKAYRQDKGVKMSELHYWVRRQTYDENLLSKLIFALVCADAISLKRLIGRKG